MSEKAYVVHYTLTNTDKRIIEADDKYKAEAKAREILNEELPPGIITITGVEELPF